MVLVIERRGCDASAGVGSFGPACDYRVQFSGALAVAEGEVIVFIRTWFRSIWTLELLLLIEGDRRRTWTAADLVRELRASTAIVSEGLRCLMEAGLVTQIEDGGYVFQPKSVEIAGIAADLRRFYAEKPMVVINEILSAPNNKLQSFADAFRFRK